MSETYLFEIPIYWCSEIQFNDTYDKRLKQHLAQFELNSGYPLTAHLRLSLEDGFWRGYIAPWRFNQVVGWVRLYKVGAQLRGEFWYMNAKRAGRQVSKKQFSLQGKAFELYISPAESSEGIRLRILSCMQSFSNALRPNCFLDLGCFNGLAKFVSWRDLMDDKRRD